MSSKKKYTSEFYLTVSSWFFFTSPFKEGHFFSNAISSQSFITIRTWTKKSRFSKLGNPKNLHLLFLGSQKNQRPKTQPGTANLRSAELWRDWNSAGWGWDPRCCDASPQRQCLGVVYGEPRWSNPPTRKPVSSTRMWLPSTRKKTCFPQKNMCFITSDKNTQYLRRKKHEICRYVG